MWVGPATLGNDMGGHECVTGTRHTRHHDLSWACSGCASAGVSERRRCTARGDHDALRTAINQSPGGSLRAIEICMAQQPGLFEIHIEGRMRVVQQWLQAFHLSRRSWRDPQISGGKQGALRDAGQQILGQVPVQRDRARVGCVLGPQTPISERSENFVARSL